MKERERGADREREREKKELVLQFYTGRYYLRERLMCMCGWVFLCVGVLVTLCVCKCVCKGIHFLCCRKGLCVKERQKRLNVNKLVFCVYLCVCV